MKKFIYKKLNAFSLGKSGGNPAACLFLTPDQPLSDTEMQSIAKDHKGFVSEVVYFTPIGSSQSYRLRYYSSECEVEFCGHGTIACMYDLIKNSSTLKDSGEISIQTNKGELKVYNELESMDAVFITAPEPLFFPVNNSLTDIAANLSIASEVIHTKYPVDLIDAGLRTLIVPVNGIDNILRINPDEGRLKDFCLNNGIDIILVFTTETISPTNKARTRVFAPKFGYMEDPATGSGNSAFGYYMLNHNLWNGEAISIEQNRERDNYNIVKLKSTDNKVFFGGNAVVKIEGKYLL